MSGVSALTGARREVAAPLHCLPHEGTGGVSSLQRGKEFEHAGTLDSEFRGPDCDK